MHKLPYALALALLAAACGGSDGESAATLDCAWLEDDDNCWRQVVRAAETCLPAEDAVGVFSADRSTCGYGDGAAVRFDAAIGELPVNDNEHPWDFTVTRGGQTCLEFTEKGRRMSVTTEAGTVRMDSTSMGATLTCPDGKRFAGGLELLECEAWDRMPGRAHGSSPMSLGFELLGMGDGTGGFLGGGGVSVFECVDEGTSW